MNIRLRLLSSLLEHVHANLGRAHPFAAERVGFLTCAAADLTDNGVLLLGQAWHPVDDQDYIDDPRVGASIGPAAFRKILQLVYHQPMAILHVHRHEHRGVPGFSRVDRRSMEEFVPSFFNACPTYPHGALVLSEDSGSGLLWLGAQHPPASIRKISVIGAPLQSWEAP